MRIEREKIEAKVTQEVKQMISSPSKVQKDPGPIDVQVMPPVHPQYGPAVYDYNNGYWTYPYAMFYGYQPELEAIEAKP